jgi:hypothetical protein
VGSAAHALAGLDINRDKTFIGMPQNENILYQEVVTSTPPDVTPNTRIVAVCGLTQKEADPGEDGWFLADMMTYYALFGNQTVAQKW